MFHQPLWQGVRSVDVVAPEGARAQLEVLPRVGLMRDDPEPSFVLDPVALDAAGQVVGFWAAEMLEQARVVFPFRLQALDLYAPAPAPGETLDVLGGRSGSKATSWSARTSTCSTPTGAAGCGSRLGRQALRRAASGSRRSRVRRRWRRCRRHGRGR